MASIKITRIDDHTDEVIAEMKRKVNLGLMAIGVEAATNAQRDCPVDTGRLHNSIAWAIKDKSGGGNDAKKGKGGKDNPKMPPEAGTVYIGTNVEYAKYVEFNEKANHNPPEFGGGKAHFLRDAFSNHKDRWKELMKDALLS